jgi:hypothetical protein
VGVRVKEFSLLTSAKGPELYHVLPVTNQSTINMSLQCHCGSAILESFDHLEFIKISETDGIHLVVTVDGERDFFLKATEEKGETIKPRLSCKACGRHLGRKVALKGTRGQRRCCLAIEKVTLFGESLGKKDRWR